jgi:hypothetical protein
LKVSGTKAALAVQKEASPCQHQEGIHGRFCIVQYKIHPSVSSITLVQCRLVFMSQAGPVEAVGNHYSNAAQGPDAIGGSQGKGNASCLADSHQQMFYFCWCYTCKCTQGASEGASMWFWGRKWLEQHECGKANGVKRLTEEILVCREENYLQNSD